MGKSILRLHAQSAGAATPCTAGLLGMALLCLPLASAAGVGMQDLTPLV